MPTTEGLVREKFVVKNDALERLRRSVREGTDGRVYYRLYLSHNRLLLKQAAQRRVEIRLKQLAR